MALCLLNGVKRSRQSFSSLAPKASNSATHAGVIPTVPQLDFARGLLLLVPLGDIVSRRNLLSSAIIAVVLGLVAIALAPSLAVLAVASLVMGIANVVPQMIVPFAASLARPE